MSKPGYDNQAFVSGGGDFVIPLEELQDNRNRESLTYTWSNINVYAGVQKKGFRKPKGAPQEKHILKNVSGICRPGELLAIMGASGAGKTTLLNVLTSRSSSELRIEGDMYVNGAMVDPSKLTKKSAYVQQEDLFIGVLTVKESLIFQATLRMDKNIPQKQRMARVEEIMTELSLTKCAHTLVGIPGRLKGISGGETKRLAFACEVLTDPPLMFCDEPTSGLDSFMAQNIVTVMKDLANRFNKTIISTIHQPSSEVFALFDRVLLMAEGRVAFLGYTSDAIKFLNSMGRSCPENFNPADFFISTLAIQPGQEDESKEWVDKVCDTFSVSETGKDMLGAIKVNMEPKESTLDLKESKSPYKASWGTQFGAVFKRAWLETIREPMILRVKMLQTVMTALLVGGIYFGQDLTQNGLSNINGALFLIITNMTFQNVFGTVNTFCTQIPIFLREHFNGMYRCDVYFLAKNLAELPLACIQPVIFTAVIYYMIGFYEDGTSSHFWICMGLSTLIANTAMSFGLLVSCMANSIEMALAIAAPLIIPFMLFGGFFLNSDTVPVYLIWMKYISWFYYGNEALNINQWRDVDYIEGCDDDPDATTFMPATSDWTEPETALTSLSSSLMGSSSSMAVALSDASSSLVDVAIGGLKTLPTALPNVTMPTFPPIPDANMFVMCNGTEVLENYGYHEEDFYLDIGLLVVLLVVMRLLAFLFLFMRSSRK